MATTERAITAPRDIALPTVRGKRGILSWGRILVRDAVSAIGTTIILLFVAVALFAPVLAPPPNPDEAYMIPREGFQAEPQAPSATHPFGTTERQYDIYYGIVWGTRTAFRVGLIVTAMTVLIGGAIGAISAFAGGWVDEIVQRIVEIFFAFPFLLAAVTLATVLGPKLHNGLLVGMIALIAFGWPYYARLMRGDVLAVKQRDYVLAARVIGAPNWRILLLHILPNAFYSLVVVASLDIGTNVLSFSALSFLGLGAERGYADWGQLISFARAWIPTLSTYWYIVVFPGGALMLFVLGWNLIGDAFRDALDPRRGKS
jgi:peptide/nickel transport system permease protein